MAKTKRKRLLTPWFPYQNAGSIKLLRDHADVINGISIFGKTPSPEFFACCRERDIDTLLLVGGKASSFDTPEHARATLDGYLKACTEDGYGGIDLDFEHVTPDYTDAYTVFLRDTAKELHAIGKRLSICVGCYPLAQHGRPSRVHFFEPEVIGECCDEVRVMCYDLYYAPHCLLGPTSSFPWARDGMRFWLQYVSKEKLIMGLPAYGNDYDMSPGAGFGWQVNFEHPSEIVMSHAIESFWLHYERLNVYRYLNHERHTHIHYASDGKSTQHHLTTVEDLDLGGISFWHYGTITPSMWQVVYYFLRGK